MRAVTRKSARATAIGTSCQTPAPMASHACRPVSRRPPAPPRLEGPANSCQFPYGDAACAGVSPARPPEARLLRVDLALPALRLGGTPCPYLNHLRGTMPKLTENNHESAPGFVCFPNQRQMSPRPDSVRENTCSDNAVCFVRRTKALGCVWTRKAPRRLRRRRHHCRRCAPAPLAARRLTSNSATRRSAWQHALRRWWPVHTLRRACAMLLHSLS